MERMPTSNVGLMPGGLMFTTAISNPGAPTTAVTTRVVVLGAPNTASMSAAVGVFGTKVEVSGTFNVRAAKAASMSAGIGVLGTFSVRVNDIATTWGRQ